MRQPTTIFWAPDVGDGDGGVGGYFLRSDAGPFIQRLNDAGKRVVGIKFDPDSPRNLEFITEEDDADA